jgi:hypothetical protein
MTKSAYPMGASRGLFGPVVGPAGSDSARAARRREERPEEKSACGAMACRTVRLRDHQVGSFVPPL